MADSGNTSKRAAPAGITNFLSENTQLKEYNKNVDKLIASKQKLLLLDKELAKKNDDASKKERISIKSKLDGIEKEQKALSDQGKQNEKLFERQKDQVSREIESVDLAYTLNSELEKKLSKSFKINEQLSTYDSLLQSSVNMTYKLEDVGKNQTMTEKMITDYKLKQVDVVKDMITGARTYYSEAVENTKKIGTDEFETLDATSKIREVELQIAKIKSSRELLGKGTTDQLVDQLGTLKDQYEVIQKTVKAEERSNTLLMAAPAPIIKAAESFGEFSKRLPGQFLINDIFGVSKRMDKFTENIRTDLANAYKTSGSKGEAAFKGVVAVAKNLTSLLSPMLLMGGLVMVGAAIFSALSKVDEEVSQVGKDLGVSKKEAMELYNISSDMSSEMHMIGMHTQQFLKAISDVENSMGGVDITTQFKNGNMYIRDAVKNTAILTEKMGLSADEAHNIQSIAAITGKSMDQVAFSAGEMGKGIFSGKEALRAVAGVSKDVAFNFKGNIMALAKAAIQAKALGIELKEVKEIGRGTLDIESSLDAEMEARVITGRDLNLDAMRYAALTGDIQGQMDELTKGLGTAADFQKLAPLQQESLAKAYGMSVDKVADMLGKQEELKNVGLSYNEVQKMQGMKAEELNNMAASAASDAQKDYIQKIAREKESASLQEKFSSILTTIKEKLVRIVAPILEALDALMDSGDAANAIGSAFDVVAGLTKAIVPIVKTLLGILMPVAQWILKIIGGMMSMFGGVSSGSGEAENAAKEAGKTVEKSMGGVTDKVQSVKAGFGGLQMGLLALAGGGILFKGAIGSAFGVAMDGAKGLLGKLNPISAVTKKMASSFSGKGGFLGKMGEKMTTVKEPKLPGASAGGKKGGGFMDSIADFINKIDAKKMLMASAAILVLAAALWVTAKAVQEFAKTKWEDMEKAGVALVGLGIAAYGISKIEKEIIQGSVALLIMSGALFVTGLALKQFTSISWEDMAKAGVALIGLGVATFAVGSLLGSSAPLIIAGGAAMIVVAASLWILGKAMQEFAKAAVIMIPVFETVFGGISKVIDTIGKTIVGVINAIGDNVSKLATQFTALGNIDAGRLIATAAGIGVLGAAIAAFGAMSAGGGMLSGLGKLFSGGSDPLTQIITLTEKADGAKITMLADGVKKLADALSYFAETTKTLNSIDTDKLSKVMDSVNEASGHSVAGEIGSTVKSVASSVGGAISSIFGGGSSGGSQQTQATGTSGIAASSSPDQKMDQVISLLSQIVSGISQPVIVKIGDKTVDEMGKQSSFKKAYSVGVDNTYSGAISPHH